MFESKGKKELNTKYNKLQGIASGGKRRKSNSKGIDAGSSGVYGELKLSENLNNEL